MSSPFTSYGYQPPRSLHGGRAARPACRPARVCTPYKPPRRPGSGRRVLVAVAIVVGLPVALVALLGLIVTGVATIPLVVGVVAALAIFRPSWGAPRRRRR